MKTILLALIIFILLSINSIAQVNVEFKKENFESKEDYDKALNYLFSGDDYFDDGIDKYSFALENYEKAAELNPNNALLNYKIGVCYYYANDNFKSLQFYNKAYQLDSLVNDIILYRIGQGYQFRLQFNKAVEYYNQFFSKYTGKEKKEWQEAAKKRIQECADGKDLIKNFVGGMVVNIKNVNSKYIDHSPLITNDEQTLFFTSRRPSADFVDVDEAGRAYENIYIAKKNEKGIWQEAINIGAPISSKNNNATIGLSPDGHKLYIYYGRKNNGDIYVSEFKDSAWSVPSALPAPINTKYQETAISFSPDGKLVYFVSNRPNGIGEKDIWVADITKDGKYENAKPLSATINTIYNERAVFVHPDGKTMYFSSEGHKTMGGFDIFKSTKDEKGEWGVPENIGYPINTAGDDVFFVPSLDNKRAYFSSLKLNSKGEQDIYMYVFPELAEKNLIVIKGTIRDESTKKIIPANIIFKNEAGKKLEIKSDPETGEYSVSIPKNKNYELSVESLGYTTLEESINPHADETKDFLLSMKGEVLSNCKPIVLENIWFDFDKSNLKSASFNELDSLAAFLSTCTRYNVEIGGHTCTAGSKSYNYFLSKKRAQSVVDYLIKKGVDAKRLTSQGYGPDKPISDNSTRAGRIKNRRVEFKLIQ